MELVGDVAEKDVLPRWDVMPTTADVNADAALDDADRADMLLALTPEVEPVLRQRLLERFGDARAGLAPSEADLQAVQGIGPKIAKPIVNAQQEVNWRLHSPWCREHDLGVLCRGTRAIRGCCGRFPIRRRYCSCAGG